jgi:ketol-acid reductoisomerase
MRRRISGTALFGDLTRGSRIIAHPSRLAMKEVLAEIRDGTFAREWLAARDSAPPQDRPSRSTESLERAGERIRRLFREDRS